MTESPQAAIARTYEGFREGRPQDVETVRGWIRAVLYGGNWRFGDPEGISQEIQLVLLRSVRTGRIDDPQRFQKFVYTVAKRTCVDAYHRERRRDRAEQPEGEGDPPAPESHHPQRDLEQRERYRVLLAVFQRLPEACRQLWSWVYGDGLPAAEVARRLNISVANARVRVHRCLERGRKLYRDQGAWLTSRESG